MSVNFSLTVIPAYKVQPKCLPAAAQGLAPVKVVKQPPAPIVLEKPWWEGLGSWVACCLAAIGHSITGDSKAGEAMAQGAKATFDGPARLLGPAPAITFTPPAFKPALPLRPEDVDTANPIAINNYLWHAAKQVLGRKPHLSEVTTWREQIQAGKTPQDLLAQLKAMPEGRMNAAAQEAFGRPLTATELAMFNLERGEKTLDAVIADITSAGHRADAGVINDVAVHDRRNAEARRVLGRELTEAEQVVLEGQDTDLTDVQEQLAVQEADTMADPGDEPAINTYHLEVF
jgi:hypothetical protein